MRKDSNCQYVTGGLASFRSELIESLTKDYVVIILASDNGRKLVIEAAGAKVILMNLDRHGTNPLKEMKLVSYYKKQMKEIKPKIVLTYTIKPNVYAGIAAASLKIPYIANITGLGPAIENGGLLQKITIPLYKYGLRKAQKVFFQNTSNRDFMVERKMVKNYDLLPGSGVNLERSLQYSRIRRGYCRLRIYFSRVVKEKGIDQYLEAAKEIRARYPETRFHICGACEDAYESILHELTNDGTIIYHGKLKMLLECTDNVAAQSIPPSIRRG